MADIGKFFLPVAPGVSMSYPHLVYVCLSACSTLRCALSLHGKTAVSVGLHEASKVL